METKTCPTCKQTLCVTEFGFKNKEKTRRHSWCKKCDAAYKKKHYSANKEKYLHGATICNYRKRYAIRMKLLEYLSQHPCVDCGETDPIILEFDHRDPSEKVCNISRMVSDMKPLEAIFAEIQKCDVRCVACHRRKTVKQIKWYEDPDKVERVPTRKYRNSKKELENGSDHQQSEGAS